MAISAVSRWGRCGFGTVLLALSGTAAAGAISFNTALPVAEDTYVTRLQYLHRKRSDEIPGGREVDVDAVAGVLGYGFSADWTGFAVTSWQDKSLMLDTPGGRVEREASGLGDTTLLLRYNAFERNEPGKLFRIAPIVGVIAPTGESDDRDSRGEAPRPLQPGSGSWGAVAGVVMTRQTLDWQVDTSVKATTRGRDEGYEPGEILELAGSYQYRLPWPERGSPAFSYAVLEAKGIHHRDDVIGGSEIDNGGTEWRLIPGLQYVTRRWIVDAAVELPVADNRPDTALRDDAIWRTSVRFNF